jgi:four helix bundle protein
MKAGGERAGTKLSDRRVPMATITQFEELECWKKARVLAREIYQVTLQKPFDRDFELKSQIRRAATSVMSNIAEGFERGGNKEFLQFLWIAKGSAAEVRSQLYLALDVGHLEESVFVTLKSQTEEISRMIAGLIRHLEGSERRGRRFDQT